MALLLIEAGKALLLVAILAMLVWDIYLTLKKLKREEELLKAIEEGTIKQVDAMRAVLDILDGVDVPNV